MNFCPECGSKINQKIIDGVNRFVCSENSCNYIYWNNPIPVVAALVKFRGNYIIARNTRWPRGIFSLITGYLESSEGIEEAILREVKEELDLEGKITGYLGHHIFTEKNQLILAFEVEAVGNVKTNHELAEIKELTAAELLGYDFHPLYITERIIKEWSNLNAI